MVTQWIKIGEGIKLNTNYGDISLFVMGVGGTLTSREGTVEVKGAPNIREGGLVHLTKNSFVDLSPEVRIKVGNAPTSGNKLLVYFDKPSEYHIHPIGNQ